MVSDVVHRTTAKGDGYCNFTLDDFRQPEIPEYGRKLFEIQKPGKTKSSLIECSVEKQRWKQDSDTYDFEYHIQFAVHSTWTLL